jgi:hypothetical protein
VPPFTDGNFKEIKWYPPRDETICSILTSEENAGSTQGNAGLFSASLSGVTDAKNYSSASAAAILMFRSGTDALSCVKVRKSRKRKKREQFRSRSKTHLHFNSTWITSKDFLLVFSGR